jgi:predicted Zn-dependent protease
MDNPRRLNEVRVRVIDDPKINAANAGGGEFQITTGLLARANDDQLRGCSHTRLPTMILATWPEHRRWVLGLNIGVILLEKFFPGSSAVTPIAGALIANSYSRSEELAADRHGVEILRRAGYSKELMIDTLTWLTRTSGGDSGGGFLSTHPGTEERIDALRKMP